MPKYHEIEELAALACGVESYEDIDDVLFENLDCDFETFERIVKALIPFTIPAQTALSGKTFQGFVNDSAFIVRVEKEIDQ